MVWSHHCHRHWESAEDNLLRYNFFQAFDELMQACEIRFERGDTFFAFNFQLLQQITGSASRGMGPRDVFAFERWLRAKSRSSSTLAPDGRTLSGSRCALRAR